MPPAMPPAKALAVALALAAALAGCGPASAQSDDDDVDRYGPDVAVVRSTDRITDAVTRSVLIGHDDDDVSAVVFCPARAGGPVVALMHKYLAGDDDEDVRVTYRVDRRRAVGPAWGRLSADNRATFTDVYDDDAAGAWAPALAAGRELVVRVVDPYDGEVLESVHDLGGAARALRRLPCFRGRGA